MEESLGAQYAIQIAVHTLRDRCKSLQNRIAVLEEDNMNLRIQCSRNAESEHSLSELDKFKEYITELVEQKEQLHNKMKMVSSENQDLWSKLGRLTTVNKNLGDQLNKISDTVNQHTSTLPHTTLIRSKTFTQDEPQTKFLQRNLDINEKISLELEDVSLKLSDSFSKQKIELDQLCSEIDGIQCTNIITENCGFYYEDKLEDDLIDEVKCLLKNLNFFREEVILQKGIIQKNLRNINNMQGKSICKICELKKNGVSEKSTSTCDIPKSGIDKFTEVIYLNNTDLNSSNEILLPDQENVCPICTRIFRKNVDFSEFQRHVEDHFHSDIDSYELL